MRTHVGTIRVAAAACALLLGGAVPVLGVAPAMADTAPSSTLYVNNAANAHCSNSGTGTAAQPYCTISAATAVVQSGQTVEVAQGSYPETVDITRGGSAAAPITIVGDTQGNENFQNVHVGPASGSVGPAFSVNGADNVDIQGFALSSSGDFPDVSVADSSDVTVDSDTLNKALGGSDVDVSGASSGVTVSRDSVDAENVGVEIDAGATGTVVSEDTFFQLAGAGVQATDAPGTVVTGNSLITGCGGGIALDGASTGSTIENNVESTPADADVEVTPCASATGAAVSVSPGSVSGTTSDYNLLDPGNPGPLYSWSGTDYSTPAAFTAATGQGGADLAADPQVQFAWEDFQARITLSATSPAIDSADADAPGEFATDFYGEPRQDDPAVPNTGTGAGYFDRGAVEFAGPVTGETAVTMQPVGPSEPLAATVTVTEQTPVWATNGPLVWHPETLNFSDGTSLVSSAHTLTHTFPRAGTDSVSWVVSSTSGLVSGTAQTVLGADYTPVAPVRLLDTRHAIGVHTTTPVPAGGNVTLPIASIDGTPAADISAVVANVTVTEPTAAGYLTVYPAGETLPTSSNLNFTKGETVPNLVTVPMSDGSLVFHNGSGGTVHVLMDLQGFYSGSGSGFKPLSPTRVLDTRVASGPTGGKPLAAHQVLPLDLSKELPSGATAAVLNLTVTQPTSAGFVTAYGFGQAVPGVSNLNFTKGETVPNLAIVPVVDGKLELDNSSGGTTHLVADLEGYFGSAASGATQTFVPDGPTRVADSRKTQAIPAYHFLIFMVNQLEIFGADPAPTALVANVTVTQPKAGGALIAVPVNTPQPPTASNLNFTTGETVPNLVTAPVVDGALQIYNDSSGSAQIIVDQEGYYIQA